MIRMFVINGDKIFDAEDISEEDIKKLIEEDNEEETDKEEMDCEECEEKCPEYFFKKFDEKLNNSRKDYLKENEKIKKKIINSQNLLEEFKKHYTIEPDKNVIKDDYVPYFSFLGKWEKDNAFIVSKLGTDRLSFITRKIYRIKSDLNTIEIFLDDSYSDLLRFTDPKEKDEVEKQLLDSMKYL